MRPNRPTLLCAIAALLACRDAAAQTLRLHDGERAQIARQAAESFGGSSELFAAMLANLDRIDTRDLDLLAARNRQRVDATLAGVPSWSWRRFGEELRATETAYRDAAKQALASTGTDEPKETLEQELATARQRLAGAERDRDELRSQETAQLATVEQFRAAIEALRNGTSNPQWSTLQKVPPALRTVLDDVRAAEGSHGLQMELLQLAVELADVDGDRVAEKLRTSDWQAANARQLIAATERVTRNLKALQAFAGSQPQELTIASTLHASAVRAHDDIALDSALAGDLAQLSRYGSIVGYEWLSVMRGGLLAESERQRSAIRLSAINGREREVLIRHQLDGLVAYYDGGIRPADVANLLRAAQAVALAVIAGRVK